MNLQKYEIVKAEQGIYYILGEIFPIQLILTSELSRDSNFWLRNLTNNLKEYREVVDLTTEYEKNRNNVLYKAMMNVIVRANEGLFEEVKEKDMCEALKELFREEIEEATKKARSEALLEGESRAFLKLIQEGILSITDVAKRLNITEAEVEALLTNTK